MERLEIHRKIQVFKKLAQTELGIDVGLQANQEEFIEILVYVKSIKAKSTQWGLLVVKSSW